jgi:proteasome lid subunit RPN8/RPN11
MNTAIQVSAGIVEEMLRHARSEPRMECCGLLAGRAHVITAIFPAKNALASATAYEIAPQELFQLFRRMRSECLDHMGIYHSHPAGDNVPSPRDVDQAYYPLAAYFVISPAADAPRAVRAFSIRDGQIEELEIQIVQE